MKERPILFSGPMVRAILDGRKTQTRRIVKPQPTHDGFWWSHKGYSCGGEKQFCDGLPLFVGCPYGAVGDRLWVRETFARSRNNTFYRCGNENFKPNELSEEWDWDRGCGEHWKPSVHMNRRYSRITLEITCVRVERLNEITVSDCVAEGIESDVFDQTIGFRNYLAKNDFFVHWADGKDFDDAAKESYESLWNSINGSESWAANPWVWAVEFKRIKTA